MVSDLSIGSDRVEYLLKEIEKVAIELHKLNQDPDSYSEPEKEKIRLEYRIQWDIAKKNLALKSKNSTYHGYYD